METNRNILDQFEEWLIQQKKSPNTIHTYISVIQKLGNWLQTQSRDLSQLGHDDIQKYMDSLAHEGKSATTIDKIYATIRVFAQFLHSPQIVDNIKRKEKEKNIYQTVPEFISDDERNKLLRDVEKDQDLRNIAIVYMLLYTGIRLSELCNLNKSDITINDQKGSVTIHSIHGQKKRSVPIPKEALTFIMKYIQTLPNDYAGPLFVSKQKKRLTTRSIQYMLEKYGMSPHKLRHTFCKDLIKKGEDLAVVAQLAGHNDINITKRYLKDLD